MTQAWAVDIPKWVLQMLNNLHEIDKKLVLHGDSGNARRNVEKIRDTFSEGFGLFYEDPLGQEFKETRTDLDATISGSETECLVVVEVIKPIIRYGEVAFSRVVQKGVVVVEASIRSGEK